MLQSDERKAEIGAMLSTRRHAMSRPKVDTRWRCAERPGRWVLWRAFLALAALALGAASARAEVLVSNLNQDAGTLDKIDFQKREYRTSPNVPGYTQDMKGEYGDESETSPGFTVKYGWNTFPRAFQIETHGSVVNANPLAHGEATVSCSVPANNPLQDAAGNEVAALSDQAVSNLTPGPPQPKQLMVRFLEGSVSATQDGINAFKIEFSGELGNAVCTGVACAADDEPLSNPSGGALTPLGRKNSGSSKVANSPRGLHQQPPPDLPVNQ